MSIIRQLREQNDMLRREIERLESGVYGDMRDELSDEVERLRTYLDRLEDAPNPYAVEDILNEYRQYRRAVITEASQEFREVAHELAEAIKELWRCECGRWSRVRPCPLCGKG